MTRNSSDSSVSTSNPHIDTYPSTSTSSHTTPEFIHPTWHDSPTPSREPTPEPMYFNQGNPAFEYHAGKNVGRKSRKEKVKKGVKRNWEHMRDAIRGMEGRR